MAGGLAQNQKQLYFYTIVAKTWKNKWSYKSIFLKFHLQEHKNYKYIYS